LLLLLFAVFGICGAQNQSPPPVVLGLSLNESELPIVYDGWPLLAAVNLTPNAKSPLPGIPLQPNWVTALHIVVRDTGGGVQSWPFHLVAAPDDNIILDSMTYALTGYWLEPSQLQAFPAGTYTVTALLDSGAYNGAAYDSSGVESSPVLMTIVHTPESGGLSLTTEKNLLLANLHLIKGENGMAESYLDTILSYDATNVTALSLLGPVLAGKGDAGGALQAYAKGISAFDRQNPNPEEPPRELLRAEQAYRYALDTAASFVVTMGLKDSTNPFYGRGNASCYYVDNIPRREIQFVRGKSYTLRMRDIPDTDAFYLSTGITGGGTAPYMNGVTGSPADSNGTLAITVPQNAPDTLYYQSMGHEFTGWIINVNDSTTVDAVTENRRGIPVEFSLSDAYPNPFNPSTTIGYTLPQTSRISLKIYNVLGELVAIMRGGIEHSGYRQAQFNALNLPSGVYFYRLEAQGLERPAPLYSATKKLLLVR